MKKVAIFVVSLLSTLSLSFAQVATLYSLQGVRLSQPEENTVINQPFKVLISSVRQLEQIYTLSSTGGAGTIALSAPTTLTTVTEELINFTGLKRGANEVRVSRLKAILRTISPSVSVGCANLSTANTLYGPTTEECVKIFQNLNELEPTGYINEATNKALNSVIGR
jgi:murein L,D-transpeptidase YcbB/YkuD